MKTLFLLTGILMLHIRLSPAQSKMKMNHLAIYVTDLNRSNEFYSQVIGLATLPEPFHDGKHVWFDTGFGTSLHVISGAEKKIDYFQNNHLCLSTANLDEFKNLLTLKKITWYNSSGEKGKVNKRPDGVLQIWIQDPDGYWLEINNDTKTLAER